MRAVSRARETLSTAHARRLLVIDLLLVFVIISCVCFLLSSIFSGRHILQNRLLLLAMMTMGQTAAAAGKSSDDAISKSTSMN